MKTFLTYLLYDFPVWASHPDDDDDKDIPPPPTEEEKEEETDDPTDELLPLFRNSMLNMFRGSPMLPRSFMRPRFFGGDDLFKGWPFTSENRNPFSGFRRGFGGFGSGFGGFSSGFGLGRGSGGFGLTRRVRPEVISGKILKYIYFKTNWSHCIKYKICVLQL